MYIKFSELAKLPANVVATVRSHGYFIYTLEFAHHDTRLLYSLDGKSVHRFENLMNIKEVLGSYPFREAWLVHESAYDEMVGQPAGAGNQLRVPFPLDLPY